MSKQIIKYLVFILYSWCVYQTYFILAIPFVIIAKFDTLSWEELKYIFLMFFFFILIIEEMLTNFNHFITDFLLGMMGPLILIFGYLGIIWTWWWKRQTWVRAWALAFSGLICGPGLIVVLAPMPMGNGGNPGNIYGGLFLFVCVNLFYPLLHWFDKEQKANCPNNKFFNTIRVILTWPCLRT